MTISITGHIQHNDIQHNNKETWHSVFSDVVLIVVFCIVVAKCRYAERRGATIFLSRFCKMSLVFQACQMPFDSSELQSLFVSISLPVFVQK